MVHVELVRTTTRDGLRLDGALLQPHRKLADPHPSPLPEGEGTEIRFCEASLSQPTAAILLHGVAGSFYTCSTLEPLATRLQAAGLAVLSVNTRGHDSVFGAIQGNVRRRLGAAYETVDDCRHDVAAWVDFLARRGHERIALIGHSLGAIKGIYAQAHEQLREVAAVVAISAPRLSYAAFMNSAESSAFWESMSTAERMIAEGRGEDLFTGKFPFPLLITAAGYLDKYGPSERYNILRFAADMPCPALFVYGSRELSHGGVAFADLPATLRSLPNGERRSTVVIEDADHMYTGVTDKLAAAVSDWVAHFTARAASQT